MSLPETNKCRNCGAFVPIEKAFCPNCSEPIEPEEVPNRAATSSSDMVATMRDDPENYKELLLSLKKKKEQSSPSAPSAVAEPQTPEAPQPAPLTPQAPQTPPNPVPREPHNSAPLPPVQSNKRGLVYIIGAVSFLILLFVLLMVFKVI